jgi:propanediol utilization protein
MAYSTILNMHTVQINLSNRHIHLTDSDIDTLFGIGYSLSTKTTLLQPGAFAAQEVVSISGPSGTIENVRVVGPSRSQTQCEILTGDTYKLGYKVSDVPIRLSGDVANSASFTLTGPGGSIEKSEGLIIAKRHIHIDPAQAIELNLHDQQSVSIRLQTPDKHTDLHDVVVRIQTGVTMECHIDTEEGNAAGISNGYEAEIITN